VSFAAHGEGNSSQATVFVALRSLLRHKTLHGSRRVDVAEVAWAVATIMRERPETVRRFVDWYLKLGARQIFLFFDNPYDLSVNQIIKEPGVHVLRGTTAFWQHLGLKPQAHFPARRDHAMNYAYGICTQPWMLCVDADELLLPRKGRVSNMLARETDGIQAVTLQIVDVVVSGRKKDDVLLRLPMTRPELEECYSAEVAAALTPTVGRVGTEGQRYAVRTGNPDLRFLRNRPVVPGRRRMVTQAVGWHEGAVVQHFMGTTFDEWRERLYDRLKRKVFAPALQALLIEAENKGDEAVLKGIYRELYEVTKPSRVKMLSRGLLVQPS
jgi:hypothetical protein